MESTEHCSPLWYLDRSSGTMCKLVVHLCPVMDSHDYGGHFVQSSFFLDLFPATRITITTNQMTTQITHNIGHNKIYHEPKICCKPLFVLISTDLFVKLFGVFFFGLLFYKNTQLSLTSSNYKWWQRTNYRLLIHSIRWAHWNFIYHSSVTVFVFVCKTSNSTHNWTDAFFFSFTLSFARFQLQLMFGFILRCGAVMFCASNKPFFLFYCVLFCCRRRRRQLCDRQIKNMTRKK